MPHGPSLTLRLVRRLESALHFGDWTVHLARAVGFRPSIRTHRLEIQSRRHYTGPPLTIGYASDFHAGPTTDPEALRLACAALGDLDADIVLLGGDFVNFASRDLEPLLPELAAVRARYGRFAVLGNHDWLADAKYISDHLEGIGIEVLTNRNRRLPPPHDHVWVCGLDDHWCGAPDAKLAFDGAEGFRILLMHAPSGLLDIGQAPFDLAFCGHTHGGQIALPGGRPIVLPNGELSRRYHRGRYEVGEDRTLVVSVGVGCALVPIRIHADPEVIGCTVAWGEAGTA